MVQLTRAACVVAVCATAANTSAQPAEPVEPVVDPAVEPAAPPEPTQPAPAPPTEAAPRPDAAPSPVTEPIVVTNPVDVRSVQFHGFVSQGAFISTANDYIGESSRGSLELFEVGINASTEVTNRLRAGVQLFARNIGVFNDPAPRIDWAFLDYKWRRWLGLRAGVIKMPFGLYNEYTDIDAARLPILMPQGVYPVRNRDALLAHRGFSAYGELETGESSGFDYQAWLGTLIIPENALTLTGATLDRVDTKYVAGAQVFWRPPVEGLRIGGTFARASIDFHVLLDPANVSALVMAGLVPADYDGRLIISQRPTTFVIGSAEYIRGKWLLAAEYMRAFKRQRSTLPALLPTFEEDSERFYAMAAYQVAEDIQAGGYYSVTHLDADDRRGHDPKYAERWHAFQRDLTLTVRYDVNEHWLWKLEAHLIDGAADLNLVENPSPERFWGLFLLRTTVTF